MRHARHQRDERGVSLLLIVVLLVGLLTIAAIVLDWALVRTDKQQNKSAADFAAAAGAQGIQAIKDGRPRPWLGACEAYKYLMANDEELNGVTGTWKLGTGVSLPTTLASGVTIPADPCDPANQPIIENLTCQVGAGFSTVPASWAWFDGTADGGRIKVDIKTGYVLPDPDFETATTDAGDPKQAGCDQIAVIVSENQTAGFGKIVGADQLSSRVRSVARVKITEKVDAAIALILLERTDCLSLEIKGGGTPGKGEVQVIGYGDQAGIIHADSNGTTNCGNDQEVIEGRTKNNVPLVRAEPAPSCSLTADPFACEVPSKMGIITTVARYDQRSNDAYWTNDRTTSHVWQCGTTAVCPDPAARPTGSEIQSRLPADVRYLKHVNVLRDTATAAAFGRIDANATPLNYTAFNTCDVNAAVTFTGTATDPNVYVNCEQLTIQNGGNLTVDADEVAFKGAIEIKSGGTLTFARPATIYVDGADGYDPDGIVVTGTLNIGGTGSCPAGTSTTNRSTLFIRRGPLAVSAQGRAVMCFTFVHLKGDYVTGNGQNKTWNPGTTPANTAAALDVGLPPYPNDFTGNVQIAAGAVMHWTAPNRTGVQSTAADWPLFEDLALWTETADDTEIGGGGTMNLRGIYFLPNARVNLSGSGSGDIDADAQFFVRKLLNNGTVNFKMTTNPQNSIPTPFFEDTSLVR